MQTIPNWLELWRELSEVQIRRHAARQTDPSADVWNAKARDYHDAVKRRWARPDSSRDSVAADLAAHPGESLLDIGAGSGAWSVYLARFAGRVTALDPSAAMLDVLRENVAEAGLSNVDVAVGAWPEAEVAPHDVVFASHSLYGVPDFAACVRKMVAVARRRCYLLLRVVLPESIMAQAALRVWGQPYDSPNFQVAYNALLQLGIFAHVQVEDSGLWHPWTHASLEEALEDVKGRFLLGDDTSHDAFLRELLARELREVDGEWVWPRGTRSALVWWEQ